MIRLTVRTIERSANLLIVIGVIGIVAFAACALVDSRTAARALLFSWLYWLGIAIGAMVLLATHALTGGRWGEIARPVLQPAARALFVAALPFIIIVLSLQLIYPWAHEPGAVHDSDIARLYLNSAGFTVRGAVILALWSIFGIAVSRPVPLHPVWAGIIIAIYMPTVTIAAVDWSASLIPQWTSSAYGALVGVAQVTAALAFAAMLRSGEPSEPATRDLSQLILAGILGLAYLGFMQLLVIWSSGVPEKTAWYEIRQNADAVAVFMIAFIVGAVLPFFQLIRSKVRADAGQSGFAAFLVLLGLAFYWGWQVVPGGPVSAPWIYLLAFVAFGAVWLGIAFGPLAQPELEAGARGHV